MTKKKKSNLIIIAFVLLLGYFADRGFYGAILLENILITFFYVVVSLIAFKGLSILYSVYFKKKNNK